MKIWEDSGALEGTDANGGVVMIDGNKRIVWLETRFRTVERIELHLKREPLE
jgi:hypothetical protein